MYWLLARFLFNVLAIVLIAKYLPGFHVDSILAAAVFVVFLSFVNVFIKPILFFITFPLQVLSLGILSFIINAFIFWFLANALEGVSVDGFVWALASALLLSLAHIVFLILEKIFR